MPRVDTNERELLTNALDYIREQSLTSHNKLRDAITFINKMDDTTAIPQADVDKYVQEIIDDAKEANKNAFRMLRWSFTRLQMPQPPPFNDADEDEL